MKDERAQESKLGTELCDAGFISCEELNQALSYQKQKGGDIGQVLIDLGFLATSSLVAALQR